LPPTDKCSLERANEKRLEGADMARSCGECRVASEVDINEIRHEVAHYTYQ
jgi:hypothetical protein